MLPYGPVILHNIYKPEVLWKSLKSKYQFQKQKEKKIEIQLWDLNSS